MTNKQKIWRRPADWEKIKAGILPLRFESLDPEPFKLIEAGADAMLLAVRTKLGSMAFLLEEE